MNMMIWSGLLAACSLCGLIVALLQWRRTRRIMENLNQMLEAAIDGSFVAQHFDETMLSAVESKLNDYLTFSVTAAGNLAKEKETIKEMIADISHQTKTPITNILLYVQLLEEQEQSEESRSYIAALRGQSEKLNFLIAALVKLSRLEAGVLVVKPAKNAIQPMLTAVAQQFMAAASEKSISLIVEQTSAEAVFDRKWTEEALGNLVDNAVKYTSSGGHIVVSVQEYELFCRIDVQDNGRGIAEEEQAQIFMRFYRGQAVSEQEGIGVGLYLSRQIAALQGGYIKVSSAPGQGATFSLFLPRKEDNLTKLLE